MLRNRHMLAPCALVFALAASPLGKWLASNGAILSTSIEVDANGLRGLKWNPDTSPKNHNIACRIPQCCILVGDNIDSLACKLLEEYELGDASKYSVYLEGLPRHNSLHLGSCWSDEQMSQLRHDPTRRYLVSLRDQRQQFIDTMLENGTTKNEALAGQAYDLVFSRTVEGRFGRQGTVRTACLVATAGLLVSVGLTVGPHIMEQDNAFKIGNTVELSLEAILSLLVSVLALGYTAVSSLGAPEFALVPWLDFCNHDSSSAPSMFEYDIIKDAIALKTTQQHRSEDWVTFNYGGNSEGASNTRLLGEHGFVEMDNAYDTMQLELANNASICIGRNGKIRGESTRNVGEVLNEARKLREILAKPVYTNSPTQSYPVDIERARIAELWRREKIRLLDEFLIKHNSETALQDSSEAMDQKSRSLIQGFYL